MPRETLASLRLQIDEERRAREAAEARQTLTPGETAELLRRSETELEELRQRFYRFQNDVHRSATAQAVQRQWCDDIDPILQRVGLPRAGFAWVVEVKVAVTARTQEQAAQLVNQMVENMPMNYGGRDLEVFQDPTYYQGPALMHPTRNRGSVVIASAEPLPAVPVPERRSLVPEPGPVDLTISV